MPFQATVEKFFLKMAVAVRKMTVGLPTPGFLVSFLIVNEHPSLPKAVGLQPTSSYPGWLKRSGHEQKIGL